jgi:hypothetical protein
MPPARSAVIVDDSAHGDSLPNGRVTVHSQGDGTGANFLLEGSGISGVIFVARDNHDRWSEAEHRGDRWL